MVLAGIDLIEINRIKKSMQNKRFLKRILSEEEISEFLQDGAKARRVAACFAAKEAFLKALGCGLSDVPMKEIRILHEPSGKPYFKLAGKAQKIVKENNVELTLSITHSKEFASAVVVGYTAKGELSI